MIGFVRRQGGASSYGLPLEVSVLVLEGDGARVVLCGVDTIGIQSPEVDELRSAVAEAAGTDVAGVLLSWNHTHSAPPATRSLVRRSGLLETDGDDRIDRYAEFLASRVVAAVRLAAHRLEPARVAWAIGDVDLSVNRREHDAEGRIVHGWRREGPLDRQVVALQARRPDESPIATLVGYGCHPVAGGMDLPCYSGDYPSALRIALRRLTGGECVFFQGAAGNVLPMISFCEGEHEAIRMGERLALEAVHALADEPSVPRQLALDADASLIPMILFRFQDVEGTGQPLAYAEEQVRFPLQPVPDLAEVTLARARYERELADALERDAGPAERYGLAYHAKWTRVIEAELKAGAPSEFLEGPVNAVRVGDGVIVSAPGETFTEIGIAVKERSPARVTLCGGYTNGALGYFPTEESYAEGGYEPAYSNRSYGMPATVAPSCERLLVEHSVRLAESLFPEATRWDGARGWKARGSLARPTRVWLERPVESDYAPPRVAAAPG
jgi:hypothetical protein